MSSISFKHNISYRKVFGYKWSSKCGFFQVLFLIYSSVIMNSRVTSFLTFQQHKPFMDFMLDLSPNF